MKQLTAQELEGALAGYTGTERYYRHPLQPRVTYSDGAKAFAERASAYWLLDIMATELPPFVDEHEIIFITTTVKDHTASISAVRDKGEPPLWSRETAYTSLPDGDWALWMGLGGPENTQVIFLPSEY